MLAQADATIYLASQRGCSQSESYRSRHTFNFRDYFQESRQPIGNLEAVNEDTVTAGKSITHHVNKEIAILVLPVIGTLQYKCGQYIEGILDVGQSQMLFLPNDSELEISSPYKSEAINFIHLWFNPSALPRRKTGTVDFDLTVDRNKLIPLYSAEATDEQTNMIFIGMFEGRYEGMYRLKNPGKGIFTYVLTGAFEVQNRLIESYDGLALWNTEEVEFEALSNGAIIIIVEF